MKHVLLKNEDDRWTLCWKYLQFKYTKNVCWKDEDALLLQPFFRFSELPHNIRSMTDEETKSFEHYKKCMNEYAEELFDLKRAVKHYSEDDILQAFGYEHLYNDDSSSIYHIELSDTIKATSTIELEYPVIAIVWIESDYSRGSKDGVCCVDFIEKKEFDK